MKTTTVGATLLSLGLANAYSIRAAADVKSCLNSKNVPYLFDASPDYPEYAEPFNLRLQYKPIAITLPTTVKHVQDAVTCAAKNNVKVQPKGGGHSYASYSHGGKDGSLIVDMENFQTIELNKSNNVVKVGGGVRLGNLADGIFNQGKRALSHGTCPGVGVGGHSTHGGYGHTSRGHGVLLDAIVGLDIVLADGKTVHATKTENADLFWAFRGAADSLGVVSYFYFQTHAAPEKVTFFSFSFGSGIYEKRDNFVNTWLHLQDFGRNSSVVDERFSMGNYLNGREGAFSVSGLFRGPKDEFVSKVQPELLRTLPKPSGSEVTSLGWIDYLIKVSDHDSIKTPLKGYDEHDNFYAKSLTVPESKGWTKASLGAWYDYMMQEKSQPSNFGYFVITNLYGGPGSQINNKDTSFSSYAERNSLFVSQLYGANSGDASKPFINGLHNAITSANPSGEWGAYQNYVDPELSAAEAHRLYYGEEVYARLLKIKKQVDPKGVFWNPQAVGN